MQTQLYMEILSMIRSSTIVTTVKLLKSTLSFLRSSPEGRGRRVRGRDPWRFATTCPTPRGHCLSITQTVCLSLRSTADGQFHLINRIHACDVNCHCPNIRDRTAVGRTNYIRQNRMQFYRDPLSRISQNPSFPLFCLSTKIHSSCMYHIKLIYHFLVLNLYDKSKYENVIIF